MALQAQAVGSLVLQGPRPRMSRGAFRRCLAERKDARPRSVMVVRTIFGDWRV